MSRASAPAARRRSALRAFVMGACLLSAGVVRAGDPVEDARVREAENLVAVLRRNVEAKDKKALAELLPKLEKAHNELRTDAARGKLQSALAELLADEELGALRLAAADAFGRLNDPKGAFKQLRPFLPSLRDEAAGPFPLRVVQAVGMLAPEAAIPALTQLMEKAQDANVSRHAIQALGKFGWSKRRAQVLGDLVKFLQKLRPGGGDPRKGRGGGQASRQRYDFLRSTLTAALNEITGQSLQSADAWLALYKENKSSIEKLFKAER